MGISKAVIAEKAHQMSRFRYYTGGSYVSALRDIAQYFTRLQGTEKMSDMIDMTGWWTIDLHHFRAFTKGVVHRNPCTYIMHDFASCDEIMMLVQLGFVFHGNPVSDIRRQAVIDCHEPMFLEKMAQPGSSCKGYSKIL